MSIWVKIWKYVDLGQNPETSQIFSKYRFWSKLSEILDFTNMSILDKIAFKFYLYSNFSKNFDLGQYLQISRFW